MDSYAYKPCYCQGWICIDLRPWHFEIFTKFSYQMQVKTKKKSYLSAGPLELCQMLNPSQLIIDLRSQKG